MSSTSLFSNLKRNYSAIAALALCGATASLSACSGDSMNAQVVDANADPMAQRQAVVQQRQARPRVVNRTVSVHRSFQEQPSGGNATSVQSSSSTDYVVQQGDTLFSIAFRYGQNYKSLAQDNGIEPPYSIKTGQVIHIGGSAQSASSQSGSYTVKQGDNLTSVSRATGIPPSAIVRVNNLQAPYRLVPGQVLTIEDPDARRATSRSEQQVVPVAGVQAGTVTDTVVSRKVTVSGPNGTKTTVEGGDKAQQDKAQASQPQQGEAVAATTPVASGRTRSAGGVTWMWPASGKVIRSFSLNENGNKGIDIAGTRGQNVMAAADGQVVYAGNALRGYGNLVIINHDNEYLSAYAHNDSLLVREGQKVKRGQSVARMGSTDSDRVNLHFEIRYRGKSVNPLGYLPR
ncbi:MAG: peptidoglycan DD-metalloendopeptidase family protein [Aeromonadales bacterium]|nr:peptidoglycan DD-metalloendopeptidase family protein [Aeromonadales bacterium]MDY2890125.1 peptidoglycan DD-metalloendopeptidase family protein [Succinivibrio sp.]